jgi:phosphoribosyl 1,2-cyclic phosphodiesterase
VKVTFCGVRGSTPVSGDEFARIGGHTSCVAISRGDALPSLLLDAGTGLQRLAPTFAGAPFRGTILLSHLHWDHVQGLPFFPPADRDDAETTLVQPAQGDPLATLARAMSPPHFPIAPDGLRGSWKFVGIEPGIHDFEGFEIEAREVEHKGGRTFGYRVTEGRASLAYVPDALDDNDTAIIDLARGVDVFVRGTPFVAPEAARAAAFGHGTAEHAVEIARHAAAPRLILTHHGPARGDHDVAAIAERLGVEAAYEGFVVDLR